MYNGVVGHGGKFGVFGFLPTTRGGKHNKLRLQPMRLDVAPGATFHVRLDNDALSASVTLLSEQNTNTPEIFPHG